MAALEIVEMYRQSMAQIGFLVAQESPPAMEARMSYYKGLKEKIHLILNDLSVEESLAIAAVSEAPNMQADEKGDQIQDPSETSTTVLETGWSNERTWGSQSKTLEESDLQFWSENRAGGAHKSSESKDAATKMKEKIKGKAKMVFGGCFGFPSTSKSKKD